MTLKQGLKDKGISHEELGRRIHRSRRTIYRYVDEGWPIPPEMAYLISLMTGIKLEVVQGNGNSPTIMD